MKAGRSSRVQAAGTAANRLTRGCWAISTATGFVDLFIGGLRGLGEADYFSQLYSPHEQGRSFKLVWTRSDFRTRGVTACDFDRDGALDVYVSNYAAAQSTLSNDGTGIHRCRRRLQRANTSPGFDGGHSIGAAWATSTTTVASICSREILRTWTAAAINPSRVFSAISAPAGFHFQDLGTCGIFLPGIYASPAAGDYDNDGNLDLYFTTVYGVASFKRPTSGAVPQPGQVRVCRCDPGSGPRPTAATYQAAWADFNHDGNLIL